MWWPRFPTRMAAAWRRPARSYGGYMIDWMLGHTQRFKALVSHAGVYDLTSEFGAPRSSGSRCGRWAARRGTSPRITQKWSPSSYVKDFHTPTLVVTGELDFRMPYTQGLQLFTALQMQKVPSKLLVFPGRRPLGVEAAEQPALVQDVSRLGRFLGEKVKVNSSSSFWF